MALLSKKINLMNHISITKVTSIFLTMILLLN